jgi:hypothetical protein
MRKMPVVFVAIWGGLIFATSSTVVSQQQLFRIVGDFTTENQLLQFKHFWGAVWIAVVKGWHVTEFAILTGLLAAVLNSWRPNSRQRNVLLAGATAILFAASDEFHQSFVPTRDGTIVDVLIDSMGVAIAMLLLLRTGGCSTNNVP